MYLIGLTGSIGMGKTQTAALFEEEGVSRYDADAAVHGLYEVGGAAVGPIGEMFPEAVRDGAVDRAALGQIVLKDGAKLAAAFTSRGVVPESGGTWILPRLIGWSKASEIIFTGKTLTAQESEEMGLISKVVNNNEIYEEAAALASKIAKNAPLAVQASKRMMRMGLNENFDDHVHHVFLQLLPLFQSDDFKEGTTAFLEKRKPQFRN